MANNGWFMLESSKPIAGSKGSHKPLPPIAPVAPPAVQPPAPAPHIEEPVMPVMEAAEAEVPEVIEIAEEPIQAEAAPVPEQEESEEEEEPEPEMPAPQEADRARTFLPPLNSADSASQGPDAPDGRSFLPPLAPEAMQPPAGAQPKASPAAPTLQNNLPGADGAVGDRAPSPTQSPNSAEKSRPAPPTSPPSHPSGGAADTRTRRMDDYQDKWELETKHSQTVGESGPVLLQDTKLHETLETFVHAKVLERAVHVKGFGAFGRFETTHSMARYTRAPLFQTPGKRVSTLTRFSLAVSTKGTPDTGRNVRGFSTKFYLDDGVFDLLCNHIPVFLVRDAIRFPESIEAFLPSPKNNLADPNRFWGFVARSPEATNFVTWLYSDVGTVKSLRRIRGFGVNTYVWENAQNQRTLVKYHWIPLAGEQYITRQEAGTLAASNPDIAGQDLYDTIQAGVPVEYELRVQLMTPEQADALPYNPLDCTKVWDEAAFPLQPVGRLTLNKNPDNYMEQIEKAAFSPANLMDGIQLSDDKMLQGRSFIYWDAQRRRLGPDFRDIPVNREADFIPDDPEDSGIGQMVSGTEVRTELSRPDDYAQAGERYASLTTEEQAHLVDNIAVELPLVSKEIQSAVLDHLYEASQEMAERIYEQMAKYTKQP